MNILIISAAHPHKMSGVLALDFLNRLSEIPGNNVNLLVKPYDSYNQKNIISIQTNLDYFLFRVKSRIISEWSKVISLKNYSKIITDPDYYFFDFDETIEFYATNKFIDRAEFKPDVVLVLFMTSFVTYKNLFEIYKRTKAKIFVYMMDMAPITSGCHYAWDCRGYEKMCGSCPGLYSSSDCDQSRRNWQFKNRYISQTDITLVSATSWQFTQAINSSLFKGKKCELILSPTNEDIYKPGSQHEARRALNLPTCKKIILFGAVSVKEKRKGFSELLQILIELKNTLRDIDFHIVIIGNTYEELTKDLPTDFTALGYLDRVGLVSAYQAASVFICTSIEDSGPTMINQSLMCGTPVVAFEMGVAPDLVITDVTGHLSKLKDCSDFSYGISKILKLDEIEMKVMRENCRKIALEKCSSKIVIDQFQDIFLGG